MNYGTVYRNCGDAPEKAYVKVYFKAEDTSGKTMNSFLTTKSKAAPAKAKTTLSDRKYAPQFY